MTEARAIDEAGDAEPTRGEVLLRWLATLLLALTMTGAGYLLWRWEPYLLPVREIAVDGEVHRDTSDALVKRVGEHLSRGLLTLDLAEIKASVEALPWVRAAGVRRLWPDRVELTVREHHPVALWGNDALVTGDGVVFRPPTGDLPAGLPRLSGADSRSELLARRLLDWAARVKPLGLGIDELRQDARGAWSMRLDNGIELAFGTRETEERLERFIGAYPHLAVVGHAAVVDLRYSNGFAVRWAGADELGMAGDRGNQWARGGDGADPLKG